MPTDTIQTLVTDCRNTFAAIKHSGGVTQTLLESLTARLDAIERDMKTVGAAANADQKTQWEAQLTALLEAIHQLASDGPANPASEMHKDFASNPRIYAIGIFATVLTALMIVLLLWLANPPSLTEPERSRGFPPELASALPLVAVMGAMGGLLNCIQSFGGYVGNRQFLRSWTLYYFLFPLKGAGLAIIVFFLIHTDLGRQTLDLGGAQAVVPTHTNAVMLPAAVVTSITTGTDGRSITNLSTNMPASRIELVSKPIPTARPESLNLVMACLVAALTGMFANQAIEMLASVFAILFKKVEGKDGYRDNQTGGAAPAKPAAK